jgi:non-specific serine/threonine protein kinase
MVIAPSTVERHVANILAKLDKHSRLEIAIWVAEWDGSSAQHQVSGRDHLPSTAPIERRRTNLPVELSSFIGRRKELQELSAAAGENRLLTLSGPGGIGKTRLALRLARNLLSSGSTEVWFVRLEALIDPASVPPAVAAALEVHEPGRPIVDSVAARIGSLAYVLVLDNCDHLLQACAELTTVLLERCPNLHVIATSRESLHIPGERVWRVPEMDLPRAAQPPLEALHTTDATRLFLERASAVRQDLTVSTEEAVTITDICRRLDGIPLAIELAAAQLRALSVHDLGIRLDSRFRLLSGGNRAASPRHQTLRAAIDWSYEQLHATDQNVLNRLSVFAGGWTLEAAEFVAADDRSPIDVIEVLSRLVDKSLVTAEFTRDGGRYRLLQTLRHYAQFRLSERTDYEGARQRHAEFYTRLAEESYTALMRPDHGPWIERLELEHDNLRAAVAYSVESGDARMALRLAGSLWRFWSSRGYLAEASGWLAQLLAVPGGPQDARAAALFGVGRIAAVRGEYASARKYFAECRAIATQLENWSLVAGALTQLGNLAHAQDDLVSARDLLLEALAIRRGRLAAKDLLHNPYGLATCVISLAEVAVEAGSFGEAQELSEEGIVLARDLGDDLLMCHGLECLGRVHLTCGDLPSAFANFLEYAHLSIASRSIDSQLRVIVWLGRLAQVSNQPDRAVRLYGATCALRAAYGFRPSRMADRDTVRAQVALSEREFATLWAEGERLSVPDAIQEGLRLEEVFVPSVGSRGIPRGSVVPWVSRALVRNRRHRSQAARQERASG